MYYREMEKQIYEELKHLFDGIYFEVHVSYDMEDVKIFSCGQQLEISRFRHRLAPEIVVQEIIYFAKKVKRISDAQKEKEYEDTWNRNH